jgi:hypothetical protein
MNKSYKILLVFVVAGLILLLFSTKIVLLMTGNALEKKQIDTTITSPDLHYYIDIISPPEGLLKSIFIRGWAFDTKFQADSKRQITMILKSDTFAYEIPTFSESREDVRNAFPDYALTANDLGFGGTFSSIAIQEGKYELFLEVGEVGAETALVKTNKTFIKEGVQFEEVLP